MLYYTGCPRVCPCMETRKDFGTPPCILNITVVGLVFKFREVVYYNKLVVCVCVGQEKVDLKHYFISIYFNNKLFFAILYTIFMYVYSIVGKLSLHHLVSFGDTTSIF